MRSLHDAARTAMLPCFIHSLIRSSICESFLKRIAHMVEYGSGNKVMYGFILVEAGFSLDEYIFHSFIKSQLNMTHFIYYYGILVTEFKK